MSWLFGSMDSMTFVQLWLVCFVAFFFSLSLSLTSFRMEKRCDYCKLNYINLIDDDKLPTQSHIQSSKITFCNASLTNYIYLWNEVMQHRFQFSNALRFFICNATVMPLFIDETRISIALYKRLHTKSRRMTSNNNNIKNKRCWDVNLTYNYLIYCVGSIEMGASYMPLSWFRYALATAEKKKTHANFAAHDFF